MSELIFHRLIYLCGFVGSGKSTLGALLADAFSWEFVDLDRLIEAELQKPIPLIFQQNGEMLFRDVESQILQKLVRLDKKVIALGAGTVSNPLNIQMVKDSGILIYLHATPEEIFKRVAPSEKRLLFFSPDAATPLTDSELLKRIRHFMALRTPAYEQSHIRVETSGREIEAVLEEIILKLKLP